MKKIAAILLMTVLLFNLGGYRLLISSLQIKADARLEFAIDNRNYNEAELVEIKVSLNMPYQQRYTEFERHYGEINIGGKAYTYVERKIDGDVLILKCIVNNEKQLLKKAAIDITKSNSGQNQDNNDKKQSTSLLKIFSGDYDNRNQYADLTTACNFLSVSFRKYSAATSSGFAHTSFQPPRPA